MGLVGVQGQPIGVDPVPYPIQRFPGFLACPAEYHEVVRIADDVIAGVREVYVQWVQIEVRE